MIHLKGISVNDVELLILFITLRVNKKNIPCLCHFSCLELFQIIMRLEICKLVYHINCWLVDNINKCFFKCQIYKNMNIEVLDFYGNSYYVLTCNHSSVIFHSQFLFQVMCNMLINQAIFFADFIFVNWNITFQCYQIYSLAII